MSLSCIKVFMKLEACACCFLIRIDYSSSIGSDTGLAFSRSTETSLSSRETPQALSAVSLSRVVWFDNINE